MNKYFREADILLNLRQKIKKNFMDVKLFVLEVTPAPLEEKHTRVEEALPLECTAERNQSVFLPWEVAS